MPYTGLIKADLSSVFIFVLLRYRYNFNLNPGLTLKYEFTSSSTESLAYLLSEYLSWSKTLEES